MPTDLPHPRGKLRLVQLPPIDKRQPGAVIRPRADALEHFAKQLRKAGVIDPKTGLVRQPPAKE